MSINPSQSLNLKALLKNQIPIELSQMTTWGEEKLRGIIKSFDAETVRVQETRNISSHVSIEKIRSIQPLEGDEIGELMRKLKKVAGSSFGSKPGSSKKSFKSIDKLSFYEELILAQMLEEKKVSEQKSKPQENGTYDVQGMKTYTAYTVVDLERDMENALREGTVSPTPNGSMGGPT